jgi:hypothetical protein
MDEEIHKLPAAVGILDEIHSPLEARRKLPGGKIGDNRNSFRHEIHLQRRRRREDV